MPKQTKAKKKPARRAKPDSSQSALSVVERAIGGKLADKPRDKEPKKRARHTV